MDEHTIKRLLKIILLSIVVIMLAKYFLTKVFTNLNKAAIVKKLSAVTQAIPPPSASPIAVIDMPVISAVSAVSDVAAASSVASAAP